MATGEGLALKNTEGETPVVLAKRLKEKSLLALMKKAAAKPAKPPTHTPARAPATDELDQELIHALKADDTALAASLFRRGADPTARDEKGLCALHWAAALGQAALLEMFLGKYPVPSVVSPGGGMPLHLAVLYGRVETARVLLLAGANVNAPLGAQGGPLAGAVSRADTAMAALLLQHGAAPNQAAAGGQTPLHQAVLQRAVDMARLLVKHGADPTLKNAQGQSPAGLAQATGDMALMEALSPLK